VQKYQYWQESRAALRPYAFVLDRAVQSTKVQILTAVFARFSSTKVQTLTQLCDDTLAVLDGEVT
jgi:hypothetical protein